MDLKILDEVAYLFVDQFDNLYGMLVDRTDVRRIRKAADDGLDAIYDVVSSVFSDKLEEVRRLAARAITQLFSVRNDRMLLFILIMRKTGGILN